MKQQADETLEDLADWMLELSTKVFKIYLMILWTLKLPSAFVLDVQSVKQDNLLQTYIDF